MLNYQQSAFGSSLSPFEQPASQLTFMLQSSLLQTQKSALVFRGFSAYTVHQAALSEAIRSLVRSRHTNGWIMPSDIPISWTNCGIN
jgi:hypothetical protein